MNKIYKISELYKYGYEWKDIQEDLQWEIFLCRVASFSNKIVQKMDSRNEIFQYF